VPYFIAACFSFGTATAKDIQTVLITRFFAGLFGSAPVTNTGGVLGDIQSISTSSSLKRWLLLQWVCIEIRLKTEIDRVDLLTQE